MNWALKNRIALFILIISYLIFGNNIIFGQSHKTGKRPTVGLVMSGGGAKGFAYIGLLKVIREAGLRIDYVAGTSMGSIVAGLYAVGYSPEDIEKLVQSEDWDMVLNDIIPRKDIAYSEKEFSSDAILTFPLKEKKLGLMSSFHEGQEVDQLLNYFLSPAYNIQDFSKLKIPFLCIGTDLISGEEVELNKGYLPDAIRASMSIPGYFSPMKIDGKYLVDGGVVNNYPVINVKNKGIDIIVGADVQSGLKDDIADLNSVTAVIDQIIGFYRVDANKAGYKNTNLYIHLPMDYGMMEFTSYDSIIAIGEKIGREHFAELKALADSLNRIEYKPVREMNAKPLDSIYINKVFIEGLDKIPMSYFKDFVKDYSNKKISILELRDKITQIYGSKFFKHATYKLLSEKGKTNLHIYVTESDPGNLSLAVHYDYDYQGSILASLSARNIFGKRSKLFASLVLGTNPRFKALYHLSNSNSASVGLGIDMYSFNFNDYEKDVKKGRYAFNNYAVTLFGSKTYKNKVSVRLGITYEYFKFNQDVVVDTSLIKYEHFSSYGTPFISFHVDSYNKVYFPTKGSKGILKVKYIASWSNNNLNNIFQSSFVAFLKFEQNFPLAKRLTLRPGIFTAFTIKQELLPPIQHWIGVGGLNPNNYVETQIPFTGVNFVQSWGYYTWITRMKMQYQLFKKLYVLGRLDMGINGTELSQVVDMKNAMFGYGLTTSYDSFIGPVELTVMGSNVNPSLSFFVNVGFWF
jgi:NTE family protein